MESEMETLKPAAAVDYSSSSVLKRLASWRAACLKHTSDLSHVTKLASVVLVASVILLLLVPSYLRAAVPSHTPTKSVITIHQASPASQERVAIIVQGTSKRFFPWNSAIRGVRQADLFYLAFDSNASCIAEQKGHPQPPEDEAYAAICVHAPVTWTAGRNRLTVEVLKHEERRQMKYKYLLYLDEDTINLRCAWCAEGPERASCCYSVLTQFMILPSVQYASLAPTYGLDNGPPYWVRYDDCVDAMMQAFHRDALPVFLPYWDNFESKGWWASQQLLFHIAHACFPPNSNMRLGGFDMTGGNQHAEYVRGVAELGEIQKVFQAKIPEILHGVMLRNGALLDVRDGSCEQSPVWLPPKNVSIASGHWRDNTAFQLCRTFLASRWGDLVEQAVMP